MYNKISDKVLKVQKRNCIQLFVVIEFLYFIFYRNVQNQNYFILIRCNIVIYIIDNSLFCFCYVGSNDNFSNFCRRFFKNVFLVYSGYQRVKRYNAQIFSCKKKRIDYCLCIFIWLKLGISFGRVNKLIKKFKIKS